MNHLFTARSFCKRCTRHTACFHVQYYTTDGRFQAADDNAVSAGVISSPKPLRLSIRKLERAKVHHDARSRAPPDNKYLRSLKRAACRRPVRINPCKLGLELSNDRSRYRVRRYFRDLCKHKEHPSQALHVHARMMHLWDWIRFCTTIIVWRQLYVSAPWCEHDLQLPGAVSTQTQH